MASQTPGTLVTGKITANGGSLVIPVGGFAGVSLRAILSGVTGGNFRFYASADGEALDGSNGDYTIDLYGLRTNSSTMENTTGALSATPVYSWDIPVAGYNFIKIVATAGTFGTATFFCNRLRDMGEPMPAVQIQGTPAVSISGTPSVTATSASASRFSLNSAATTNATSVKASAGDLMSISWTNFNASAKYLKLYNKASAPTVGTDVPVLTIPLAPTAAGSFNFGEVGQRFDTGIAYAITGAIADTDTTVVAAGDVKVLGTYK